MKEEKQGTILIIGWLEKEDMVFIISDDGAGMEADQLKALQNELKAEPSVSPDDSKRRSRPQESPARNSNAVPQPGELS